MLRSMIRSAPSLPTRSLSFPTLKMKTSVASLGFAGLRNQIISNRSSRQPNEQPDSNQRGLYFSTADFNHTVEESLQKWCKIFMKKKISEPLESIANILASVLRTNNLGDVYNSRKVVLSDLQVQTVHAMCEKRLEQMPVQYIIGDWDFRDINLKLRPPVFIPRPETEILVELALTDIKKRNVHRVLELCCGSGAISCSLLHSIPKLNVVTNDISSDACNLCEENVIILGLKDRIQIANSSVIDFNPKGKFDVIISNPPYVLRHDMKNLQPEILRYESAEALDGGIDGLDVVKQIFALASRSLNPGGRLFLEVDLSHPQLIRQLLADGNSDLVFVAAYQDLTCAERFIEIIKNPENHPSA